MTRAEVDAGKGRVWELVVLAATVGAVALLLLFALVGVYLFVTQTADVFAV